LLCKAVDGRCPCGVEPPDGTVVDGVANEALNDAWHNEGGNSAVELPLDPGGAREGDAVIGQV
jgi:hypothetical protein